MVGLRQYGRALTDAILKSRSRRELEYLDPHMLRDIGVTRVGDRFVRRSDGAPVPAVAQHAMEIRESADTDMRRVQHIYAHHVLHGSASFDEAPPTLGDLLAQRVEARRHGLPYLVAVYDGVVAGYCYATPYRSRSAYRYSIENAVYVANGMTRRGIGRALLTAMIARCDDGPWRQMIAVIGDSRNAASVNLHRRLGFRQIGTIRAVGWKFSQWTDTVLMQRPLNGGNIAPPP
jgi:phosphinothricin acetyltransferase